MTATDTNVLQVTNVSTSATMEQLETLFSFLGTIDEMQVYPKTNSTPIAAKVAFIRYQSTTPVATGQHLTNTVFVDKALVCVPYKEGKIPDENTALQYVIPAAADDPQDGVESLHSIPGNVDPTKVEEIRRTIYVGNLDSKTATAEQLLQFFTTCGEVRFVRMAGDETQPTRFAFVEFADQSSVQNALQLNGMLFGDRPIKVNHSNNAIVKPQGKTQETTAKEIEEAMRRVREAQSLISKALEPEVKEKKRRSRSRSRSPRRRRRSRSGSKRRRSGSRSRRRRRSRSRSYGRSRSRRSRSRSRHRRRRSKSRSPKRSRSHKRTRSRSKKRSASPAKKKKSRSRSRSKSPSKKSSRHKKDRKRDRDRDRDRDSKKRRRRSRSRSGSKGKDAKADESKKNGDKDSEKGSPEKKKKDKESTKDKSAETEKEKSRSTEPVAVVANGGDSPSDD